MDSQTAQPIYKDPNFTALLKSWKFISCFHSFIGISDTASKISLYEFRDHVVFSKFPTKFQRRLISSLVGHCWVKENDKSFTLLGLLSNTECPDADRVFETCFYELGHSYVNLQLKSNSQESLIPQRPFHQLSEAQKFEFIGILVTNVSNSSAFNEYWNSKYKPERQLSKQEKEQLQIDKFYEGTSETFLGRSDNQCLYFFFSQIPDRIMVYSIKESKWHHLVGASGVQRNVQKLIDPKGLKISCNELELVEKLMEYSEYLDDSEVYAFNESEKLSLERAEDLEPLSQIQKMCLQMEEQYSKMIRDCYNSRWADKKERIRFRENIEGCRNIAEFKAEFSQFFNQTKHKSQSNYKSIEPYDYSLSTEDLPPSSFHDKFLFRNPIYSVPVFPKADLYSLLKKFFEAESGTGQGPFAAYEITFFQILIRKMLSRIEFTYSKAVNKRKAYVQKEKKRIAEQEEEQRKGKSNNRRSARKKGEVKSKILFSSDEEESQSKSTLENRKPVVEGRQLRKKGKNICYRESNSKLQKDSLSKSKLRANTRSMAGGRVKSKKALTMDSDSEEEADSSDSSSESERQANNIDQSLEAFKFSPRRSKRLREAST